VDRRKCQQNPGFDTENAFFSRALTSTCSIFEARNTGRSASRLHCGNLRGIATLNTRTGKEASRKDAQVVGENSRIQWVACAC
jgi:hypothetical protein